MTLPNESLPISADETSVNKLPCWVQQKSKYYYFIANIRILRGFHLFLANLLIIIFITHNSKFNSSWLTKPQTDSRTFKWSHRKHLIVSIHKTLANCLLPQANRFRIGFNWKLVNRVNPITTFLCTLTKTCNKGFILSTNWE